MSESVYRCHKCNRRLPVVEVSAHAVILCRHCKEMTRIDATPPRSAAWTGKIEVKNR